MRRYTTPKITRDGKIMLACIAVLGVMLVVVSKSDAATLFTVAEQRAQLQVTKPQRFEAIIGFPNQCVSGITCWTYTKGTRSPIGTFPESWYAHQNGVRVKDSAYGTFVMDTRSTGWQQHVASTCGQRCFIDGMGTPAVARTKPRLQWTPTQWVTRAALVVKAVVKAGKMALPNSVGSSHAEGDALIAAANGRGSTEDFNTSNAQSTLSRGRIWVAEIGSCLDKYHVYLKYRGTSDHFACYEKGHLPWDTSWLR